jgi:hypothetical protein
VGVIADDQAINHQSALSRDPERKRPTKKFEVEVSGEKDQNERDKEPNAQ